MNDDAYRDPPPPRDTEGPTSLWEKAFAHFLLWLRPAAHPAHIGPLGLGVLLSAHEVPWFIFLSVAIVSSIVGAIVYEVGTSEKSKNGPQIGIALVVWAGIFCIMGALFGAS